MEKRRWSYSRLEKYQTCPHAYYLKYVAGFDEHETPEMILGHETHRLIQACLTGTAAPEASLEAQLLAEKVLRWILDGQWTPVAVEKEFEIPLDRENVITGVIDAILKKHELVLLDWKTGWRRYSVKKHYQQLGLYVWAARLLGYNIDKCGYMLVRYRFPFRWESDLENIAQKALDWAKRLINQVQQAHEKYQNGVIAPEAFPAKPNSTCGRCSFLSMCPFQYEREVSPWVQ